MHIDNVSASGVSSDMGQANCKFYNNFLFSERRSCLWVMDKRLISQRIWVKKKGKVAVIFSGSFILIDRGILSVIWILVTLLRYFLLLWFPCI